MNQIQHGIFMHNGVILTQQQYFMMVHNYVSERNMDIDISHRIYRIIHNIPGFIPIIPLYETRTTQRWRQTETQTETQNGFKPTQIKKTGSSPPHPKEREG
jgi:hypothetical protein